MTPTMLLSIGVFGGTMIGYVFTKKKDFRSGLSVGVGAATLCLALLQYIL